MAQCLFLLFVINFYHKTSKSLDQFSRHISGHFFSNPYWLVKNMAESEKWQNFIKVCFSHSVCLISLKHRVNYCDHHSSVVVNTLFNSFSADFHKEDYSMFKIWRLHFSCTILFDYFLNLNAIKADFKLLGAASPESILFQKPQYYHWCRKS